MNKNTDTLATDPITSAPAPRRHGLTLGRVLVGLATIAFLVWIGVRLTGALAVKAEMAKETTQLAAAAKAEATPRGQVVRGQAATWAPRVPVEGTLMPLAEADLSFKAGGRVASIRVRAGQLVQKGETLATLEDTEAAAQAAQADAQMRAAEAQLALADDGAKRSAGLVESGAASQVVGVQARQQRALAQAQLDAARATRALAQANLDNHRLKAPFAGYVTRVPAGPGGIVGPGVPLFHLQDTTTLKLVGTVGESDAQLVQVGAPVELRAGERVVKGKVAAVMPSMDQATRRVPIECEIPGASLPTRAGSARWGEARRALPDEGGRESPPLNNLRAGSFVRATIDGGAPIAVLKLPSTTLRPGSQDEVFVVEGGVLRSRQVTFTTGEGGTILVRAGLQPADAVLLQPSAESKDGDAVLVKS